MMKEEPWLQKIQERLKDYSEPVPPSGWQSLEKDLPLQRQVYANGRERQRLITLRRYAIVGAAAVLLAAISSVSVWLMHTPVVEGWQQAVSPAALVTVPDVLPSSPLPSSQGEDIVSGLQAKASPRPSTLLAAADDAEVAENASSDTDIPESGNEETYNNRQTEKAEAENGKRGAEPRRRSLPPSSTTDMFAMANEAPKRRGWSVALSVGNVGGVGNMANDGGGTPTMQSSPNAYLGINLCSADAIVTVLEGREILYKEGMPYLAESRQIAHIDHRLPVSFGVTFRKNLPKGFSVETGLVYTLLASEVTFNGSMQPLDQKLHYLGIPLRANWNFLESKSFTLYMSGGGMVEKCLYGKIGSDKATVGPLQFSALASVGAQYNFNRRVGIYVEPGFAYFFDDGSDIETIRKDNPANFTLQAGIRLTY